MSEEEYTIESAEGDFVFNGAITAGSITGGSGTITWDPSAHTHTHAVRSSIPKTSTSATVHFPPSAGMGGKAVRMPNRAPRKVLVAFLDEDDNVEWAAKLGYRDIQMSMESGGVPTMQLELPLFEVD